MEEYRTEEEQIDAIKKFWQTHGNSILTGGVVALSIVIGYQWWTSSVQKSEEAASQAFEQVVDGQQIAYGGSADEEAQTNLVALASSVIENHADTTYAHMSALVLAKSAVESDDLAQAEQHLVTLLDQRPSKGIELTATLRLAKIYLSQDKHAEALDLLDANVADTHRGSFEELKGDIYRAQGDLDKARSAYSAAANAARTSTGFLNPILQMKIDDTAA